MRTLVLGAGAVGARVARQLSPGSGVEPLIVVDKVEERARAVVESIGPGAEWKPWSEDLLRQCDVVVLAVPRDVRALAQAALERGVHVVAVGGQEWEVRPLLELDTEARERSCHVVVGAGFSPGLSCLLARHAGATFDEVDEVHVARVGTGGPDCARQHRRGLLRSCVDWRDGTWVRRRGGSGRELCWFPDPLRGRDCYRSGSGDSLLLAPAFPGVGRVTTRVAASPRERLLSVVPSPRSPAPEGAIGGIRVEVRGRRGQASDVVVLGVVDRPAAAAGTVAAVAATWAVESRLARTGAAGLAELVPEAVPFLRQLADRGVRAAVFEGTSS
ncbi:MAG TPA: NAD(P)-binding domain-containing protein, partial [Acidimicrobiales bacterium]|nr:NAD(P)-binding domain-containing protein [Acidimicrobiales bacterium]